MILSIFFNFQGNESSIKQLISTIGPCWVAIFGASHAQAPSLLWCGTHSSFCHAQMKGNGKGGMRGLLWEPQEAHLFLVFSKYFLVFHYVDHHFLCRERFPTGLIVSKVSLASSPTRVKLLRLCAETSIMSIQMLREGFSTLTA